MSSASSVGETSVQADSGGSGEEVEQSFDAIEWELRRLAGALLYGRGFRMAKLMLVLCDVIAKLADALHEMIECGWPPDAARSAELAALARQWSRIRLPGQSRRPESGTVSPAAPRRR